MNPASLPVFPPLNLLVPELVLVCLGLFLVVADLFLARQRFLLPVFTVVGALASLVLLCGNAGVDPLPIFNGMYAVDAYSLFFKAVILIAVIFTVLLSGRYLKVEGVQHGEYYSLLTFSAVGMMVMVSARDLIVLYLGLELMALSIYCLVGFLKHDQRSNEAALKYFLMGAFSSGLLLYGISLIYGLTGTTSLYPLAARLNTLGLANNHALLVGLGLVLVAFCFKVAAAPFHMWSPDAYEGAPSPISAFMSVGPKGASFAALGSILFISFGGVQAHWGPLLAVIALLTMAVGNILAISQKSVKRMLAYSSIAHAGYILLGLLPGNAEGLSAILTYMLIYAFMNMGAFGILILLCDDKRRGEQLDDYRGLAKTNPVAAALMLVFMFSLTGIPPTAGFIGKFNLLLAAVHAGYVKTVVIAVILSAISAYYYLRVVRYMYMLAPEKESPASPAMSPGLTAALTLAMLMVIAIGVAPGWLLDLTGRSLLGFSY